MQQTAKVEVGGIMIVAKPCEGCQCLWWWWEAVVVVVVMVRRRFVLAHTIRYESVRCQPVGSCRRAGSSFHEDPVAGTALGTGDALVAPMRRSVSFICAAICACHAAPSDDEEEDRGRTEERDGWRFLEGCRVTGPGARGGRPVLIFFAACPPPSTAAKAVSGSWAHRSHSTGR